MEDSQDQQVDKAGEQGAVNEFNGERQRSRRRNRRTVIKKRRVFILSGLILIILLSVGIPLWIYTRDQHVMLPGIKISGIDVGNLSRDKAKETIDHEINRLEDQTIKLNTGKQSLEVKLRDLGLLVTDDSVLQKAYDMGRTGSLGHRLVTKISASKGINLELSKSWDDPKLKDCLSKTLN
ncbi:MAG: peptidoglycan binding domain-containing protein [Bacillota bacterium]|nr:peptidoglycan binding domain-containing protein [Bacillota bacterium]